MRFNVNFSKNSNFHEIQNSSISAKFKNQTN